MSEKVATDSKSAPEHPDEQRVSQVSTDTSEDAGAPKKKKVWYSSVFEAGSATQIVIAAVLAIALGLGITAAVDTVPVAATKILAIPGQLWLRCLKAVG